METPYCDHCKEVVKNRNDHLVVESSPVLEFPFTCDKYYHLTGLLRADTPKPYFSITYDSAEDCLHLTVLTEDSTVYFNMDEPRLVFESQDEIRVRSQDSEDDRALFFGCSLDAPRLNIESSTFQILWSDILPALRELRIPHAEHYVFSDELSSPVEVRSGVSSGVYDEAADKLRVEFFFSDGKVVSVIEKPRVLWDDGCVFFKQDCCFAGNELYVGSTDEDRPHLHLFSDGSTKANLYDNSLVSLIKKIPIPRSRWYESYDSSEPVDPPTPSTPSVESLKLAASLGSALSSYLSWMKSDCRT